jgi:hypothetical protein
MTRRCRPAHRATDHMQPARTAELDANFKTRYCPEGESPHARLRTVSILFFVMRIIYSHSEGSHVCPIYICVVFRLSIGQGPHKRSLQKPLLPQLR